MQKKRIYSISTLLLITMYILIITSNIKYVSEKLYDGAAFCIQRVLPSLFPFMIASDILSKTLKSKHPHTLQLILGFVFGIPICSIGASRLYSEKVISRRKYETLICIGNIPGIGFFLGVCGNIFGIKRALCLYATTIISALLSGAISNVIKKDTKESYVDTLLIKDEDSISILEILSDSLKASSLRCITILGCISFFYMLSSSLTQHINDKNIKTIIFGFFEFSGGCSLCGQLGMPKSYIVCSAILAFSGLSAFMQSVTAQKSFGFAPITKKYFLSKLLQASLNSLFSATIMSQNKAFKIVLIFVFIGIFCVICISQRVNKKALKNAHTIC